MSIQTREDRIGKALFNLKSLYAKNHLTTSSQGCIYKRIAKHYIVQSTQLTTLSICWHEYIPHTFSVSGGEYCVGIASCIAVYRCCTKQYRSTAN